VRSIRALLIVVLAFSFSVVFAASVSRAAEENPLLGFWTAPPDPGWVGFERIYFGPAVMWVDGVGDISIRSYRVSKRLGIVVTDDAGNFDFEIRDRNRICLFPPRIQLASTEISIPGRRCYSRSCSAPPTIRLSRSLPGCPHRSDPLELSRPLQPSPRQ
jgi:hypothetical protein